MRYPALIDGEKGAYGVVFPDLPGCNGMGSTIEEAIQDAQDAMPVWMEVMEEGGRPIPEPSALEDVEVPGGSTLTSILLVRSGRHTGSESDVDVTEATELRPRQDAREVFVVHGRDRAARDAMFEFLRSIGLHPLEWSEAVQATGKATPYIGQILDAAFSRTQAIVVLLTPDDEAHLKESLRGDNEPSHEVKLTGQARPNVLFEAGMAMGRNPDRTILVELGDLRGFSDMAGLHVIRLDGSSERRQDLAKRLQGAGCPVNLDGTDWHSAGDFGASVESGESRQVSSSTTRPVDGSSTDAIIPQITEDAKSLLVDVSKNNDPMIQVQGTQGGTRIWTNKKNFGEMGVARSEARWQAALNQLVTLGLIEDQKGDGRAFVVTNKGFQIADSLGTAE